VSGLKTVASAAVFGLRPAHGSGLLLTVTLAAIALILSRSDLLTGSGLGLMTLAIVIGIAVGNTGYRYLAVRCNPGIDLARTTLLRAGIVIYGARMTFQDIAQVGWVGLVLAVLIMACTLMLAVWLGRRLGLDRPSALLIGAGSAICGAAAVMATQSLARAREADVAIAVTTVVVFGTLAMLFYPWLYAALPMSPHEFGVYAGATVHEVAQVVVVGEQVGGQAARAAVIEKMLRVMMLAPFLLLLPWSGLLGSGQDPARAATSIPWFAIGFLVMIACNSTGVLPASWRSGLLLLDSVLLTMAMSAIGLRTDLRAMRRSGLAALKLAAGLFVFLVVGGFAIHQVLMVALA
jgi:uncharacterized integral membrane protein (TIGR00698 family)